MFNEQPTLLGGDGDKLVGGAIQNLYDVIDNSCRPSPEAKAAIVRIDTVGTAASARVYTDNVSG